LNPFAIISLNIDQEFDTSKENRFDYKIISRHCAFEPDRIV
jgi:hypothetical protein